MPRLDHQHCHCARYQARKGHGDTEVIAEDPVFVVRSHLDGRRLDLDALAARQQAVGLANRRGLAVGVDPGALIAVTAHRRLAQQEPNDGLGLLDVAVGPDPDLGAVEPVGVVDVLGVEGGPPHLAQGQVRESEARRAWRPKREVDRLTAGFQAQRIAGRGVSGDQRAGQHQCKTQLSSHDVAPSFSSRLRTMRSICARSSPTLSLVPITSTRTSP